SLLGEAAGPRAAVRGNGNSLSRMPSPHSPGGRRSDRSEDRSGVSRGREPGDDKVASRKTFLVTKSSAESVDGRGRRGTGSKAGSGRLDASLRDTGRISAMERAAPKSGGTGVDRLDDAGSGFAADGGASILVRGAR